MNFNSFPRTEELPPNATSLVNCPAHEIAEQTTIATLAQTTSNSSSQTSGYEIAEETELTAYKEYEEGIIIKRYLYEISNY